MRYDYQNSIDLKKMPSIDTSGKVRYNLKKMPSIGTSSKVRYSLLGKEYGYACDALSRNIGSNKHYYDGYGLPIGSPVVVEWHKQSPFAWFNYDPKKIHTSNYIDYANTFYFGWEGGIDRMGFLSQSQKEWIIKPIDIRDYKVGAVYSWKSNSNPNNILMVDTSLGSTNAFYTDWTFKNSRKNVVSNADKISENAYYQFGVDGIGNFSVGGDFDSLIITKRIEDIALLEKDYIGITWNYGLQGNNDVNSETLFKKSSKNTKSYIKQSLLQNTADDEWENPIDYLSKITSNGLYTYNMSSIKSHNGKEENVRYAFDVEIGNKNLSDGHKNLMHADAEGTNIPSNITGNTSNSTYHEKYAVYDESNAKQNDIIKFTTNNFRSGKYDTLIGRFASNYTSDSSNKPSDIQGAVTAKWGMSHGRNLLKKKEQRETKDNTYANPYCRVWTYHHQYAMYQNLIRPFNDSNKDLFSNDSYKELRTEKGLDDFKKFGVVDNTTGLPRIAPTQSGGDIRNLMFSIENLAWKNNTQSLESSQKGPNGGRIMWFPPYGLKFNESIDVTWNPTQFIGRGESIYTYTNTERQGNLDFMILIDHPSIINKWQNATGDPDEDTFDGNGYSNDIEQGLLRFFAGCDILEPTTQDKKKNEKDNTPKQVLTEDPTSPPQDLGNTINFNVFFPNNYSGMDDDPIDAMYYLVHGIGGQVFTDGLPYEPSIHSGLMTYQRPILEKNGWGYEMGDLPLDGFMNRPIWNNYVETDFEKETSRTKSWLVKEVEDDGIDWVHFGFNKDSLLGFQQKERKSSNKTLIYNTWGYRCDEIYQQQVLQCRNYTDRKSYKLNSVEYMAPYTQNEFTSSTENLYSFADIFYLLDKNGTSWSKHSSLVNKANVEKLKAIINTSGFKVTNVYIVGQASKDGYTSSNNELSQNRSATVFNWLKQSKLSPYMESIENSIKSTYVGDSLSSDDKLTDVNSFTAKVWRSVRVIIQYEISNISQAQENPNTDQDNISIIADNLPSSQSTSEKYEKTVVKMEEDNEGYGKEYLYFKDLHNIDPFLHHRIIDKIKYFDPAFHSISPEGFNARLTFLHQCTRAGNTNSATESNGSGLSNATNLAYGAPPVCVLKIGDFIHTKIIIKGLNISYDDASWDLNPEGIGVMPMLARVSMNFTYIGSQSLSNPIARLGNALSFNYYANTEVYDNRSELYLDNNQTIVGELL